MNLAGVVFLSGHTERAKAYAQAMAHAGLAPALTMLYGAANAGRPGQRADSRVVAANATGIFLPDLRIELTTTLADNGWDHVSVITNSINDPVLVDRVRQVSARLIVFCGYGGEIVKESILSSAPVLHVHSGWLPDYRGSTTGYYSWLEEGVLGASAIVLDKGIDTGSVVMRRRYPLPPPGADMDYLWDPAIRADLLVSVLTYFQRNGALPKSEPQEHNQGRTFYVVHPVLKHIALLSEAAR